MKVRFITTSSQIFRAVTLCSCGCVVSVLKRPAHVHISAKDTMSSPASKCFGQNLLSSNNVDLVHVHVNSSIKWLSKEISTLLEDRWKNNVLLHCPIPLSLFIRYTTTKSLAWAGRPTGICRPSHIQPEKTRTGRDRNGNRLLGHYTVLVS